MVFNQTICKNLRDIFSNSVTKVFGDSMTFLKKDEICIQDKYDKRILARRYGILFDCNNCGRNWMACKDDILEGYELDVKLRCPYCHNMINIPRNFNWI